MAGVSADVESPGWIRLYPVNFRHMEEDDRFKKYNIVEVDAKLARGGDPRVESWRPQADSLKVHGFLPPWVRRRQWLDPYIDRSMCEIQRATRGRPDASSLALVESADVTGLTFEVHPGWTKDEKAKIDAYVSQLGLFGGSIPTPLEAPRLRGVYHWRCHERTCKGHNQGIIDWEFVALQRRYRSCSDDVLTSILTRNFLKIPNGKKRNLCFFVGNQAKRTNTFSILGLYYPD